MMRLQDLFKIRYLPTGRRLFAMQQMLRVPAEARFTELDKHLISAIEHDRVTRDLEVHWDGRHRSSDGQLPAVDRMVDQVLVAIRDGARTRVAGLPAHHSAVATAEAFLAALFPNGVAAVIQLPCVDELAVVDTIVSKLQGQLQPSAAALGLTPLVERLATLAIEYRRVLEERQPPLSFAAIKSRRRRGQLHLLASVAMVLSRSWDDDSTAHQAARSRLLAPILEQREQVIRALKQRRVIEDVDPDTGEVDPGPAADEADDAPLAEAFAAAFPSVATTA